MKDKVYLVGFLGVAALLLFLGRDQLPSSTFLTWGLTFGATTAAAVLIVSLYRVQLELKQSRHELSRKDAELNFAREVQAALFPARLPERSDLTFAAVCIPAQGISGDFYDVMECEDGRVVFAIADVSGKGISAAILMANAQAVLRTLIKTSSSLAEVCSQMNTHLHQVTKPNKFATFFVAQYLPATRELEYVNAGHQPPIVCGVELDGKLDIGGPPIGMFPGIVYSSGKIKLEAENLIVLYSDGINESRSRDDLEFGDQRLLEVIRSQQNAPLVEIQTAILNSVAQWCEGDPDDDMTIMLVRAEGREIGSLGDGGTS